MSGTSLPVSESFILAGIASMGGLITVLFAAIRQSRCSSVTCCCFRCTRTVLNKDEIELEKAEEARRHMSGGGSSSGEEDSNIV